MTNLYQQTQKRPEGKKHLVNNSAIAKHLSLSWRLNIIILYIKIRRYLILNDLSCQPLVEQIYQPLFIWEACWWLWSSWKLLVNIENSPICFKLIFNSRDCKSSRRCLFQILSYTICALQMCFRTSSNTFKEKFPSIKVYSGFSPYFYSGLKGKEEHACH